MSLQKTKQGLETEVSMASQQVSALNESISKNIAKIFGDPDKLKAYELQKKLIHLKFKHQQLLKEDGSVRGQGSTQEVLLNQVKNDNQEISAMERKIAELEQKIFRGNEEIGMRRNNTNNQSISVERIMC